LAVIVLPNFKTTYLSSCLIFVKTDAKMGLQTGFIGFKTKGIKL